ncbi:nitroreductase family protein [Vibrio sp. SS-MA-C1-2]|uniref:nitroreductase family protein n=1 Tax=Vibrio sp. SS-MA-C1-2 TaxID=2908646 RepID=UPI001F220867|nr:nitroreductase family protein [Vibrio sp. SS-MA-C1-2]UJF17357.1 nitroreductase family protein [Vibrio sp. SS-MA-C1-2]
MNNQILTDLNHRYTTKHYDDSKKIPIEIIEIIKEAIRLSASSINCQPWKFILLGSEEAKARFSSTFANKFQFNQRHATEASHIILFAYDPLFTKEKYKHRADIEVSSGHLPAERYDGFIEGAYSFAELNTDEKGFNGHWTKAQTYLALGNTLHVLARLNIDSTPMEGVDSELISKEFEKELDGHVCEVALAMGYHKDKEDYNFGLPKARLPMSDVLVEL